MDSYCGEIRILAFTFPPMDWAFCDGTALSVSANAMLHAVIGYTYGGNRTTTFAIPNLQGRAPIGSGQGPGLSNRTWGQTYGTAAVALNTAQVPPHTHTITEKLTGNTTDVVASPSNTDWLSRPLLPKTATASGKIYVGFIADGTPNATLHPSTLGFYPGEGGMHDNQQPALAMNYCISLYGIFPVREN